MIPSARLGTVGRPNLASAVLATTHSAAQIASFRSEYSESADSLWLYPRPGGSTRVNPPRITWPRWTTGTYDVEITDAKGLVRTYNDVTYSYLLLDAPLPYGRTSIRIRTHNGSWKSPYTFTIDRVGAVEAPVPSTSSLLSTVSGRAHPRFIDTARCAANAAFDTAAYASDGWIRTRIDARSGSTGLSTGSAWQDLAQLACDILLMGIYHYATNYESAMTKLKSLTLEVAGWTTTSPGTGSDSSSRQIIAALAYGFDIGYNDFTSGERTTIYDALVARADAFYNSSWPGLDCDTEPHDVDQYPEESHIQGILEHVVLAACATVGHAPPDTTATGIFNRLIWRYLVVWKAGCREGGGYNEGGGYWSFGNANGYYSCMAAIEQATGVEAAPQWFRQAPEWIAYMVPKGKLHWSFGDEHESNYDSGGTDANGAARFMTLKHQNPLADWYSSQQAWTDIKWPAILMQPARSISSSLPSGLPLGRAFLDPSGHVAMHSSLDSTTRTSVFFRSSPNGYQSHGHASQNEFRIDSQGKRLAIKSGYYDGQATNHWDNWYAHARGNNCLTVNSGTGQVPVGGGGRDYLCKILSFAQTANFDIVTGDGTNGVSGITRHYRTIIYYRPSNQVVIIDSATAGSAKTWEWNWHSVNQPTGDTATEFKVSNSPATARVIFAYCNLSLSKNIHNTWYEGATEYPPTGGSAQWHTRYSTTTTDTAFYLVTVVNIDADNTAYSVTGNYTDGWTVTLNSAQTFHVNPDGTAYPT